MATSPILRRYPRSLRRLGAHAEQTSLTLFPPAARHGNGDSGVSCSDNPSPMDGSTERGSELVGIARLAANSLRADAKRGTQYFLLPSRSILNRCDSERVPFRWTINPYRGCEFGCRYCYARYTHEYMDLDGSDFEKKIYAKQDASALVERDLSLGKAAGEHIAIGTATDPYQPAEKQFGSTRAILEKIASRPGLNLSITTKSNQVVRDLDLLGRIAQHSAITVNITITTLRPQLARLLEPRAPHPRLRLEAIGKLREAGIPVGVLAMPIIPGLTDREPDLEKLAIAARDAGAQWFCGNVLFLMPASWKTFLAFLEERFPRLAVRYRDLYRSYGYAPRSYQAEVAALVERLRTKYGLGSRPQPSPDRQKTAQLEFELTG